MSTPSLADQANAVRQVTRLECIKPLRPRGSEADLLLERLRAAAATLDQLAATLRELERVRKR